MPLNLGESKIYNPYSVYLNQMGNDRFKYRSFHDSLRNLPEKLQDFIFDTMPADFIKDQISVPFGLNENQSKEIAKMVMELILTDIYLGNVVDEVKNRLGIDDQKARTIAGLLVTELFAPILEDLKKMHIEKFAKNIPNPQLQKIDDRIVDLKNNL